VDKKAVTKMEKVVRNVLPFRPMKRPSEAETMKDNKGMNKIDRYMSVEKREPNGGEK